MRRISVNPLVTIVALAALSGACSDGKSSPAADAPGTAGAGGSGTNAAPGTSGATPGGTASTMGGKGTQVGGAAAGTSPVTSAEIPIPDGGIEAPKATTDLELAPAPELGTIKYLPNRSSVILYLPGVEGARDYRVFAVEDGVKVLVKDGAEHVDGGTLNCAGLRQRNQCDDGAILPIKYNDELLDLPVCEKPALDRRQPVPAQLMQTLEVDGVQPDTTLVVEAIDRMCPFPGLWGSFHHDEKLQASDIGSRMADVVVDGKPYTIQRRAESYSLYTEQEIRAQYGSMILNGQAPNLPTFDKTSPAYPESPYIRQAQPAPAEDPVVLARSVIKVSPTGTSKPIDGFEDGDYFDDFEDDSDVPVKLRDTDIAEDIVGMHVNVFEMKKWILYDVGNPWQDFFVSRGQLNLVFGDPAQDSMSLQAFYPKRPVQLPTEPDKYLRVTYEVQRNETPRRYENLTLCGAEKVGETYDGETPRAAPGPRPGFMNDTDTARSSSLGWNCLYLIPRGAGYGVLAGGDIKSHADSSVKITVIKAHDAPAAGDYDKVRISEFATGLGPTQDTAYPRQYFRQVDDGGKMSGVWLDDELNVWQKTRFDVFISRDRVVIYVKGQQRICQSLKAAPLTMAEGALGFWHILYHSSAEHIEMTRGLEADNPSTGQRHLIWNTPWADQRSYDNVGFKEDVGLPENFDAGRCLD
jgi:hypothetical protein